MPDPDAGGESFSLGVTSISGGSRSPLRRLWMLLPMLSMSCGSRLGPKRRRTTTRRTTSSEKPKPNMTTSPASAWRDQPARTHTHYRARTQPGARVHPPPLAHLDHPPVQPIRSPLPASPRAVRPQERAPCALTRSRFSPKPTSPFRPVLPCRIPTAPLYFGSCSRALGAMGCR